MDELEEAMVQDAEMAMARVPDDSEMQDQTQLRGLQQNHQVRVHSQAWSDRLS